MNIQCVKPQCMRMYGLCTYRTAYNYTSRIQAYICTYVYAIIPLHMNTHKLDIALVSESALQVYTGATRFQLSFSRTRHNAANT